MSAMTAESWFQPRRALPPARSARVRAAATWSGRAQARPATVDGGAQLRLTGRGRVVVVTLALLGGLAGVLGAQAATAGSPAPAVPVVTHTVAAGETLWAIASGVAAPGEDVRDVVADLMELNGLTDAGLRAGQQVLLPAER